MNVPPTDGVTVHPQVLQKLVGDIFGAVPVPEEHAELIARLLVDTDLRGVVSHGVLQVERYARGFQKRTINPLPEIEVLRDGPATAALSGDGGLGIVVASEAMGMAIEKARACGVGVVTTTCHDHIGSAGKYVRMALREHLVGIAFSGRSCAPSYPAEATPQGSIQGSPPLAFGTPSDAGHPDFLLDFSSGIPWDEEVFARYPELYFRGVGLSHVANILSGTLGGQMLSRFDRRNLEFTGADQSGFFTALDVERFVPVEAFEQDVGQLMGAVSQMTPFPGYDRADLPGDPEWRRERAYSVEGVPICRQAADALEALAGESGLTVPWQ
jgi:LDH2 family malate/lactate/ureidoglycolate dehydrogenase